MTMYSNIAYDHDGVIIERAIAWADAHDRNRTWLRIIESGDWLTWPPEIQAEFLSQITPSFLGDYSKADN